MAAADTIENLIKLGSILKDASQAMSKDGPVNWTAFLGSPEYNSIKASVDKLLGSLKDSDIDDAIRTIVDKQTALLGGKTVADLPTDKLIQYSELADTRLALAAKKVSIAANGGFFGWLVNDALPVLVAAAPKVLALVL